MIARQSVLITVALGLAVSLSDSILAFPTVQKPLLELYAPKPHKTVCYEDIGCFSTNGTFASFMRQLPTSPELIKTSFTLFSKHNVEVGQNIHYSITDSLTTTLLKPDMDTVFLIHGFSVTHDPRTWFLKNAFLNYTNSQVIVVDWRNGSQAPEYWTASANSELVGRQVGKLIHELKNKRGLNPKNIHIVGSSLGAHAAGFAGKWTLNEYGFTIGRISANDPAGPYFEDGTDNVHLSSKDALFVDVIHTSAGRDILNGEVGIKKPIGHVDFYPNEGSLQPGCQRGDPICSHMRADDLYADSLKYPGCSFKSLPCADNFEEIIKENCQAFDETTGQGELGYYSNKAPGRRIQYLETNDKEPFCKT